MNPKYGEIDLCRDYNHITVGQADPLLFVGSGQAVPTSRVLDGSQDDGFYEEWSESGTYLGEAAERIYLFAEEDTQDDEGYPLDPADYPWGESIARIVLTPA